MNMAVFRGPSRQTILNCSFPVEQINDNEINEINNLVIRSWIIFFKVYQPSFPHYVVIHFASGTTFLLKLSLRHPLVAALCLRVEMSGFTPQAVGRQVPQIQHHGLRSTLGGSH